MKKFLDKKFDEEIIIDFSDTKSEQPVCVLIPSYNHQGFIQEALESVARQTFQDFNVIIIDDASQDTSLAVIIDFIRAHPQLAIKLIRHRNNEGAVQTLNELISISTGKYLALLNSDDVWLPDKLRQQFQFLELHQDIGAVFTHAYFVDKNLNQLHASDVPFAEIFLKENRSRGSWLNYFFYNGNCLCHPSIMVRKSIYAQLGDFDIRFSQLPDMQMWIRMLKLTQIHIIQEPLVLLRWHGDNTSAVTRENTVGNLNELINIYFDFFDSVPLDLFKEGFSLINSTLEDNKQVELECEKAFRYLDLVGPLKSLYHQIGIQKLYKLMGEEEGRCALSTTYNFTDRDFIKLRKSLLVDKSFYMLIDRSDVENQKILEDLPKPTIKAQARGFLQKTPFLYKIIYYLWVKIKRSNHE